MLFSLNYTYMHARDHFACLIGKITRGRQSKSVMCRWSTGIEQWFWKINLFSPRYCWTNAELAVHNNHSLTHSLSWWTIILVSSEKWWVLRHWHVLIDTFIFENINRCQKGCENKRPFYLFKIHLWCKSIVKTVHYF
jgi:hypothetical protein